MVEMFDWTIGSDPEVFLIEKKAHTFYSAFNGYEAKTIWGDKTNPEPTKYGAIQVDGMAVEFNTEPTTNPFRMWENILDAKADIRRRYPDCTLSTSCLFELSEAFLKEQPEKATELGCDPDYDAYTLEKKIPDQEVAKGIRTAGGHIHIGWNTPADLDPESPEHLLVCGTLVKRLDSHLCPVMNAWPNYRRRTQLYGGRGSFRPKPYGLEYRAPSNYWIFRKDRMLRTISNVPGS